MVLIYPDDFHCNLLDIAFRSYLYQQHNNKEYKKIYIFAQYRFRKISKVFLSLDLNLSYGISILEIALASCAISF
jgi:hypothetical protein